MNKSNFKKPGMPNQNAGGIFLTKKLVMKTLVTLLSLLSQLFVTRPATIDHVVT